jgi:hypothetical protein
MSSLAFAPEGMGTGIRDAVNPQRGTGNYPYCAIATDHTLARSPASALDVPPGVEGLQSSAISEAPRAGSSDKPLPDPFPPYDPSRTPPRPPALRGSTSQEASGGEAASILPLDTTNKEESICALSCQPVMTSGGAQNWLFCCSCGLTHLDT